MHISRGVFEFPDISDTLGTPIIGVSPKQLSLTVHLFDGGEIIVPWTTIVWMHEWAVRNKQTEE